MALPPLFPLPGGRPGPLQPPACVSIRLVKSCRSRFLRQRRAVPDRHRAIVGATSQQVTIRAKSQALEEMSREGEQFPAGLRIPQLHRFVIRYTGQTFTVGAEGHIENSVVVPSKNEEFAAGLGIPHLYIP